MLYLVVLITLFISRNACYAQIEFTTGENTERLFIIEDLREGDIVGAGTETGVVGGTGADFPAVSALIPLFIVLASLLLAAPTAPAAPASRAPIIQAPAVLVPVQPPTPVSQQTITVLVPPTTTPCVSETCPTRFSLLTNQAISSNCYFDSGPTGSSADNQEWSHALLNCASTPGAYLWKPNTEQEAFAVNNKFNFGSGELVWTGANNIRRNGIFTFAIENGQLDLTALPFGLRGNSDPSKTYDCVDISFNGNNLFWDEKDCDNTGRYICEYPRRVCQ